MVPEHYTVCLYVQKYRRYIYFRRVRTDCESLEGLTNSSRDCHEEKSCSVAFQNMQDDLTVKYIKLVTNVVAAALTSRLTCYALLSGAGLVSGGSCLLGQLRSSYSLDTHAVASTSIINNGRRVKLFFAERDLCVTTCGLGSANPTFQLHFG